MQMPRPTDDDRAAFLALVPDRPDVAVKPMFGQLAAFVNGTMFMGLFGATIGIRLPDTDREGLLAVEGTGPFGPSERPMGGYVALPASWREHPELSAEWVTRALGYVAALPPKAPRKRR